MDYFRKANQLTTYYWIDIGDVKKQEKFRKKLKKKDNKQARARLKVEMLKILYKL